MSVGPADDRERVGAFDVVSVEEHPDAGEDEGDGAEPFACEEPDDASRDGVIARSVEREIGGVTVVLAEGLDGSFDTLLHFWRNLASQLF